jgi:PAS domain S-box-containing protein
MSDRSSEVPGRFNFAADGILVADAKTGRINDSNPCLSELLGYSGKDLKKKKLWEICPEEIRAEVEQAFFRPGKDGSIRSDDFWLETKGGLGVPVDFWGQKYSFGKSAFVQCLFKAGTDRGRAAGGTGVRRVQATVGEAAAAGESRFRSLFESFPGGTIIFGAVQDGEDFVVNEINAAAERIEGVVRKSVLGRSVLDAFPGFLDLGIFHGLKHCWISGSPGRYPAAVYSDKGKPRWRKCDVFQLPSSEIVCVYEDITENKEAEDALGRALKEKDLLLKEIHHRVKNNIQILYSLLRLQSAHIVDPAVRGQLLSNLNRVRAMSLVQERLHASNSFSRIDFPAYIQNLIVHLQNFHHADPGRILIGVDMEACMMDIRQAVPLGLIVNELISNAFLHAFPEERAGKLSVFLRSMGDRSYRLAVKDDGVGVPPGVDFDLPDSFGLQIVKTLTDQLNGELRISRDGGTEVQITFLKSDPKQIIEEMNYY